MTMTPFQIMFGLSISSTFCCCCCCCGLIDSWLVDGTSDNGGSSQEEEELRRRKHLDSVLQVQVSICLFFLAYSHCLL
jgi:hypothetical protein